MVPILSDGEKKSQRKIWRATKFSLAIIWARPNMITICKSKQLQYCNRICVYCSSWCKIGDELYSFVSRWSHFGCWCWCDQHPNWLHRCCSIVLWLSNVPNSSTKPRCAPRFWFHLTRRRLMTEKFSPLIERSSNFFSSSTLNTTHLYPSPGLKWVLRDFNTWKRSKWIN